MEASTHGVQGAVRRSYSWALAEAIRSEFQRFRRWVRQARGHRIVVTVHPPSPARTSFGPSGSRRMSRS